jgi:hypothetical protein
LVDGRLQGGWRLRSELLRRDTDRLGGGHDHVRGRRVGDVACDIDGALDGRQADIDDAIGQRLLELLLAQVQPLLSALSETAIREERIVRIAARPQPIGIGDVDGVVTDIAIEVGVAGRQALGVRASKVSFTSVLDQLMRRYMAAIFVLATRRRRLLRTPVCFAVAFRVYSAGNLPQYRRPVGHCQRPK